MRRWRSIFAGAKYLIAGAFAAGAFVAMSGAVNADGMAPRAAPVLQAPTTWSGLYFGAHTGWAWTDVTSNFVDATGASLGTNDSVQHDAPVVGGQIGLQHQFGQLVVGLEGGLTVAYQNSWGSVDCPNVARTCTKRFDDVLWIGPRIGWAMGRWMPYLTGGYANAHFEHESHDKANYVPATVLLGDVRLGGWYIGGGVDMALAHGWTLGLEYRHYDFGSETLLTHLPTGVPSPDIRNVDATLDTVTLRVSWKFDRPDRAAVPLK
jgi:outer membrane immunogenic protein